MGLLAQEASFLEKREAENFYPTRRAGIYARSPGSGAKVFWLFCPEQNISFLPDRAP